MNEYRAVLNSANEVDAVCSQLVDLAEAGALAFDLTISADVEGNVLKLSSEASMKQIKAIARQAIENAKKLGFIE